MTANEGKKSSRIYFEDFKNGCGGWVADKMRPLVVTDGIAYCWGDPTQGPVYAPWSVDFWHAPPGGGYLFLLMWLHTDAERVRQWYPGYPGNDFVRQNMPKDFTNAEISVRLKGYIDLKEAKLHLWVQALREKGQPNYCLTGQPIPVSEDWSEQKIILKPDPEQWKFMGGRWDRPDYAGGKDYDIADVLKNLNVDIIFVLYPLNIVPDEPVEDMHHLRAGVDYAVKTELLPKGVIMFDWVKIEFAEPERTERD